LTTTAVSLCRFLHASSSYSARHPASCFPPETSWCHQAPPGVSQMSARWLRHVQPVSGGQAFQIHTGFPGCQVPRPSPGLPDPAPNVPSQPDGGQIPTKLARSAQDFAVLQTSTYISVALILSRPKTLLNYILTQQIHHLNTSSHYPLLLSNQFAPRMNLARRIEEMEQTK
jgi:hypothetical protein